MSVGVIGQGYVGGSLTTVFAERGETVFAFDPGGKLAAGGIADFGRGVCPADLDEFIRCCEQSDDFSGLFFVCVPTPMAADGSADVSIVESILEELAEASHAYARGGRVAVIKSTVPPGSVEQWNLRFNSCGLQVVFNPEFLTAANALNDMRQQDRIVVGGPAGCVERVRNLYQGLFPAIPVIETGSTTAEMVKYVANCMLAVKVSFANEMAQICEALDRDGFDVEYDEVIECVKLDRRLGDTHWAVPGPVPTPDGRHVRGFGGHCLPKDINALMRVATLRGVDPKVMRAAWEKTLEVRDPEDRDWSSAAEAEPGEM